MVPLTDDEKSEGNQIFQQIDEILAELPTNKRKYVWGELLKAGKGKFLSLFFILCTSFL